MLPYGIVFCSYFSDFLDREQSKENDITLLIILFGPVGHSRPLTGQLYLTAFTIALKKELRIRVLDKILVKKVFLNKRWEETEQLGELYKEELA